MIKFTNSLLKRLMLLAFLLPVLCLNAQTKTDTIPKKKLIQFSGVVVGSDSLDPIPFASLIIRNTNRGTISDFFGYFSFVAQTADTIEFSALGYRRSAFVIPDTLTNNQYSLIEVLVRDTIYLEETVIFPWPSPEQFKEAFLQLDIPDDDLARAQNNLARASIKDKLIGLPPDGSLNFKYQMQQQYSKLYYAGQYPSINLFNPVAWSKFIRAWQDGDFKKKD